jgi:hypothetical protein
MIPHGIEEWRFQFLFDRVSWYADLEGKFAEIQRAEGATAAGLYVASLQQTLPEGTNRGSCNPMSESLFHPAPECRPAAACERSRK